MFAFVLIKTQPIKERQAFSELNKIPEVVELNALFGEYDLMAKIGVEDGNFESVVKQKIEKIPGITVMKVLNCC
jgi:DNA-binding Lrp family transcriptional regulator